MKKVNKSTPPNLLTLFAANYPNNSWDNFRNHNASDDYREIKGLIFTDQGGLCAYCEKSLKEDLPNKKRIEHYHSKSDKSTPGVNWALDWNNVIGVCLGGSDTKQEHPLPKNFSCDAHKAHLEDKNKLQIPCVGYVLDPQDLVASPVLFDLDKSEGKLIVNVAACAQYTPKYNNFETVEELVEKTIEVFNLNCDRLIKQRLKVLHRFEHIINAARKKGNTQIHSQLAERWFINKWPSFFTTRRIILGRYAEQYLNAIQYDG